MLLFDNELENTYDEIKTWYPVWYLDVLDMNVLLKIYGKHFDDVRAEFIRAVDNNFIDFADAQTVSRLERFLDIVYDGPRTLAERRNVIKAFIIGSGRIGRKEIQQLLGVLTNGTIDVAFAGGTIDINVKRDFGDVFNLFDARLILDSRIPAHLALHFIYTFVPVRALTQSRFIFTDLNIQLAAKNQPPGTTLTEFTARMTFRNYGTVWQRFLLDGTWKLDGSHYLGGYTSSKIFSGMTARNMKCGAYKIINQNTLKTSQKYSLYVANSNSRYGLHRVTVGLSAAQKYKLSGTVTMDGRWQLDGSVKLDGSRKLNSIYEQEEL
jgi:hypothetical protein